MGCFECYDTCCEYQCVAVPNALPKHVAIHATGCGTVSIIKEAVGWGTTDQERQKGNSWKMLCFRNSVYNYYHMVFGL